MTDDSDKVLVVEQLPVRCTQTGLD